MAEKLEFEYQNTLSLLMAIRSIHWVIVILKKSGFPKDIINLYEAGEKSIKIASEGLPKYEQVRRECETDLAVDAFHRIEEDLGDYSDRAFPSFFIDRPKYAIQTTSLVLTLYETAISRIEKSALCFNKTAFLTATNKLADLIRKHSKEITEMTQIINQIDSLELELEQPPDGN